MLPVLIGLGLLIGLPVLYIFRRWHGLVSAERRAANLLAVQARRIPNQPGAMTVSEAVTAKNILMEASELPSLTPRDIPEVSRLWDARHLIDAKACQRTDHHDHVAHSAAVALLGARVLADTARGWSESGRDRELAKEVLALTASLHDIALAVDKIAPADAHTAALAVLLRAADELHAWGREATPQTEPKAEGVTDFHRMSSGASDKREKPRLQEVLRGNAPRLAKAFG